MDEAAFIKTVEEQLAIERRRVSLLEEVLSTFSQTLQEHWVTEPDPGPIVEVEVPADLKKNTPTLNIDPPAIDEEGWPQPKGWKSWAEDDARLKELFTEGKTDEEISKILDRGVHAVKGRRVLLKLKRRRGNKKNSPNNHQHQIKQKIIAMVREGKTNTHIAKEVGKAVGQINFMVAKLGDIRTDDTMVEETVIIDGIPVQKLKPGWAVGSEAAGNRRYGGLK